MAKHVLIRGVVSAVNLSGQKQVRLMASNTDGFRFWTDDNSLIPTSEVARVVRCEKCHFWHPPSDGNILGTCYELGGRPKKADGFCDNGIRRETV